LLRMRLMRMGAKKRPSYRVVVADARAPRDGRHVDILGFYDPMTNPSTVRIDVERAVQWLRKGAQPTDRVRILLRHAGVLKAWEEARLADKRARKEQAEALAAARAARLQRAERARARRAARAASGEPAPSPIPPPKAVAELLARVAATGAAAPAPQGRATSAGTGAGSAKR
jgi:small subunit ribosomal protein S16